uniref:beta strand repeat-containing protein n=1 Tax=Sphingomonas sp. TaxID=28214 RepID=UPI00286D8E2B
MRFLLATSGLGAIATVLSGSPALAETVISTATTTPVATATGNDDIRITTTGSVRPTSGTAVTINSNDSVNNQGAIGVADANNATGILANPNLTGNITNSGTITLDENYTPTDTDNDGDLDGVFAQGSNRYGIHVLSGGTFTGAIVNSGRIIIEGNDSAGIAIDSPLIGSIANSGDINILGNNVVGLRATDVSGSVTFLNGTITAQGQNAVGVSLGDVGGALVFQNTINVTGYRYPTPPADVANLDADDLLQGGPAVIIAGDVGGGILFDARPADNSTTDTDEDDDGIADASEPNVNITSFGSAAAVQIGSATRDIAIGAVASSTAGHGLVTRGTITGSGVYDGIAANAIVIGGQGHAVDLAGGITVAGTVQAGAINANATALRLGAGTSAPAIVVTGVVSANGGGTATSGARAIVIDAGATVNSITNSGTIAATRGGTEGTAVAVLDSSGTLDLIENSGFLGVVNPTGLAANGTAFDLRANAGGATVRQLAAATGQPAPTISGNMLFGAGNDVLDAAAGNILGNATFGAGANQLALSGTAAMTGNATFGAGADSVTLGGTSSLTGNIDFGGGADTLALTGGSRFTGLLSNSAGTAVSIGTGSRLIATNTSAVALASLDAAAGSTLGVSIASGGAHTLYDIAGAASFGAGSEVAVNFINVGNVEGTYTILQAGTLTGAGNVSPTVDDLPFLFDADVVATTPNELDLVVRLKSAEELGLNRSEGAILAAALAAADSDAPFARMFLGVTDSGELSDSLQQLLPEHAGGAFESATKGSRLAAQILADPRSPIINRDGLGVWLQQVAWGTSKSVGNTSSYDLTGWGATGGIE